MTQLKNSLKAMEGFSFLKLGGQRHFNFIENLCFRTQFNEETFYTVTYYDKKGNLREAILKVSYHAEKNQCFSRQNYSVS
jgi:hypothetical protein